MVLGIGLGRVVVEPGSRPSQTTAKPEPQFKSLAEAGPPVERRRPAYRRPVYEEPLPPAAPEPAREAVPAPQVPPPAVVVPQTVVVPETAAGPPAWRRYAALAPDFAGRPAIAIVIDDVGHDPRRQAERLRRLPGPVTLAMLPYGYELRRLSRMFRKAGHEVLVHLPMEPSDAAYDPGPNALLTSLDRTELARRIGWNLGQFDGYVGINNHMGSRFTADAGGMGMVMAEVKKRGLLFLDSWTTGSSVGDSMARRLEVPRARRDIFIDNEVDVDKVLAQLAVTERLARRRGYAIAIGHPHDETLTALERWLPGAQERGFVLVPVSAIIKAGLADGDSG